MRKLIATAVVAVGAVAAVPSVASADGSSSDQTLADVLLADSAKDDENGFDRRFWDYDIVTQALLALDPDGTGLVGAASDPNAELTAFLPNDLAFRRLVYELGGGWVRSEADVFQAVVDTVGVDGVANVLAYHIVPAKISYDAALQSDGATLKPLASGGIDVDVKGFRWFQYVQLEDDSGRRMTVVQPNVGGEAANGFAHGIGRVLLPAS